MFCKNCNREVRNGVKFCPYCGSTDIVEIEQKMDVGISSLKQNEPKEGKWKKAVAIISVFVALAVVAGAVWMIFNDDRDASEEATTTTTTTTTTTQSETDNTTAPTTNTTETTTESQEGHFESGSDGDFSWKFYTESDKLVISGTGDMSAWLADFNYPWSQYADKAKYIVFEEGITSIGHYAFADFSKVTSISLPDSLISINRGGFSGCESLITLDLPVNLENINTESLNTGESLTSITVAKGNKYFLSEDGVLFNADKTELIKYPPNKPSKSYDIPDGVTTIRNYAFGGAEQLETITIPVSVTIMAFDEFNTCDSLKDVYYGGTEQQWNESIKPDDFDDEIDMFAGATVHFAS